MVFYLCRHSCDRGADIINFNYNLSFKVAFFVQNVHAEFVGGPGPVIVRGSGPVNPGGPIINATDVPNDSGCTRSKPHFIGGTRPFVRRPPFVGGPGPVIIDPINPGGPIINATAPVNPGGPIQSEAQKC